MPKSKTKSRKQKLSNKQKQSNNIHITIHNGKGGSSKRSKRGSSESNKHSVPTIIQMHSSQPMGQPLLTDNRYGVGLTHSIDGLLGGRTRLGEALEERQQSLYQHAQDKTKLDKDVQTREKELKHPPSTPRPNPYLASQHIEPTLQKDVTPPKIDEIPPATPYHYEDIYKSEAKIADYNPNLKNEAGIGFGASIGKGESFPMAVSPMRHFVNNPYLADTEKLSDEHTNAHTTPRPRSTIDKPLTTPIPRPPRDNAGANMAHLIDNEKEAKRLIKNEREKLRKRFMRAAKKEADRLNKADSSS